jgi:hypothetical protein
VGLHRLTIKNPPQTSLPQVSVCGPASTNNKKSTSNISSAGQRLWACIDGFVCDATDFLKTHPGGLAKLLNVNTGAADSLNYSAANVANSMK